MSNDQQQPSSQDSSSGEQKLSPSSISVSEGQNKSAPEYPPATKRSQRTNSANFGEGKSDDDPATF